MVQNLGSDESCAYSAITYALVSLPDGHGRFQTSDAQLMCDSSEMEELGVFGNIAYDGRTGARARFCTLYGRISESPQTQ